jgi:hypothetical protein
MPPIILNTEVFKIAAAINPVSGAGNDWWIQSIALSKKNFDSD